MLTWLTSTADVGLASDSCWWECTSPGSHHDHDLVVIITHLLQFRGCLELTGLTANLSMQFSISRTLDRVNRIRLHCQWVETDVDRAGSEPCEVEDNIATALGEVT